MATTVADVATLGLQSEELEELIEDFREKNIYGDEGVEARIKSAEQQLNELDRIEGNDPDLPWYQRPSQTKTRAEIAKETGTAVGMILSPDTLTPFAFAALGRSAVTATMRKSMQLSGELVELQGKRQLLQSSQKAAAASPFGKGAASQLQRQIDNIDGTIAATEKRLLRVSQAIEPRLLSAVGAMGRKIRSVPFKASGAALQSAGTLLKRMNPALSGLTQGAAFYGLTGGNPFVGALGVIAGMTGQGGRTFALGQRLSKVGLEWGKRRTALPFFRKLADESKDSVFRRQLFLAGDFALGKPVRMTRQFADYYRRAFIAEVPFSYIAAGGASYAGGNWLTDAMAEALAFEAPMAMGANVTGSLMGMKTAGTVEEQNRLATNAALNFRDEFLRDPEKRAVFDALPPVAKRALGNYHTAFPDLHWDFDVSVANGSSYYDSDSNTIRINPNDPRGAEAAMAHEFRHYLDAQGFEQGVVDELVGPSGILRLKDGSYMPSFVTWANNENKLRGDKWDLSRNDSSDWAEAALEWSAYSSMDGLASSVRHNALIKATQRHPWMRSLMDAIMPASYRQKSLMNMGLLFDSDGTVSVRKGLPGRDAYKQQAAIAKRVQRYMRDRAGIGATDADRADLHDPEKSKKDPNAILPNDQEGLNQVESVMTPDLEHDAQGNVILKNGEAQLIPQEIADARAGEGQPLFGPQIEQESNVSLPKVNVGRGTDNGTDLTGVAKMHRESPTGALVGAARLKEMLRSLPFSDYQLEMFDEIVDILSDPSRRGESLLSFYFPVWRKKRGKGNWRNFVPKKGIAGKWGRWAPYALVQSDEGNLLVYGISHDQVAENIAILAKSASGRKLYDGSVGRIASDFELMVTNWGKDIKNITQFTDEQLNFLNAIFGNVGKGNPDFNPALLEAPFKKLRSAVRSYRLDRFARIQTLPRDPFPFALEKGRRRELPFEEQAMEGQTTNTLSDEELNETVPADTYMIYGPGGAGRRSVPRSELEIYKGEQSPPQVSKITLDKTSGDVSRLSESQYPVVEVHLANGGKFRQQIRISDHDQVSRSSPRTYDYDYRGKNFTAVKPQVLEDMRLLAGDIWQQQKDLAEVTPEQQRQQRGQEHTEFIKRKTRELRSRISTLEETSLPSRREKLQQAIDRGDERAAEGHRKKIREFEDRIEKAREELSRLEAEAETQTASDADYLAAVEAGDMEAAQRMVNEAALLPREVFYLGDVEVIRNPTVADRKKISAEVRSRFPMARDDGTGYFTTRFTEDSRGNHWIWKAHEGMHSFIEPKIKAKEGVKVGQNQFVDTARTLPVTYDDQGNVIPLSKRFDTGDDIRGEVGRPTTPVAQPGGRREMPAGPDVQIGPIPAARATGANQPNADVPRKLSGALITDLDLNEKEQKRVLAFRDKTARSVTEAHGLRDLSALAERDPEQAIKLAIRRMADNLVALFNSTPENLRDKWKQWYDIAHDWTRSQAKRVNTSGDVVAAMVARLSPGKDWFNNLTMVEQILSTVQNNPVLTKEHLEHAAQRRLQALFNTTYGRKISKDAKKSGAALEEFRAEMRTKAGRFVGQRYNDILKKDTMAAAIFTRAYGESVLGTDVIDHEGNVVTETFGNINWQSYDFIARALEIYERGDRATVNRLLGDDHKIRAFYNNMVDPNNLELLDVTIDTHAVGAALLLPVAQKSPEVSAAFGSTLQKPVMEQLGFRYQPGKNKADTGLGGNYWVFADAYRLAAQEVGVLPRELQSIVWEAVRDYYPAPMKRNPQIVGKIRDLLHKTTNGTFTRFEALQNVEQIVDQWNQKQSRPKTLLRPISESLLR